MILALDLSLSSTGYCIMSNDYSIHFIGKITTKSKEVEEDRIFKISSLVNNLIVTNPSISVVVIEDQFCKINIKTALQLSRLRGAIVYISKVHKLNIMFMTPSCIRKHLFDNSSAKKNEIALYIQEFYSDNQEVQKLGDFIDRSCKAKNSDIYDAISIAMAYLNVKGGVNGIFKNV